MLSYSTVVWQLLKPFRVVLSLHLNGVQSRHVHLEEPILPVVPRDSRVVDAARYVLEGLSIFQKAVVLVVNGERTRLWGLTRELEGPIKVSKEANPTNVNNELNRIHKLEPKYTSSRVTCNID